MAVNVTYYAKTLVWGANTWDSSNGGSIEITFDHEGDALEDRTGDNEYPPFAVVVNRMLRCTVRLRDLTKAKSLALNSKNDLVATLSSKASGTTSTVQLTMLNAVLKGIRGSQGRASVGDVELSFIHESSDGAALPLT